VSKIADLTAFHADAPTPVDSTKISLIYCSRVMNMKSGILLILVPQRLTRTTRALSSFACTTINR